MAFTNVALPLTFDGSGRVILREQQSLPSRLQTFFSFNKKTFPLDLSFGHELERLLTQTTIDDEKAALLLMAIKRDIAVYFPDDNISSITVSLDYTQRVANIIISYPDPDSINQYNTFELKLKNLGA